MFAKVARCTLSLLLSVCLSVGFAGCGKKEAEKTESEPEKRYYTAEELYDTVKDTTAAQEKLAFTSDTTVTRTQKGKTQTLNYRFKVQLDRSSKKNPLLLVEGTVEDPENLPNREADPYDGVLRAFYIDKKFYLEVNGQRYKASISTKQALELLGFADGVCYPDLTNTPDYTVDQGKDYAVISYRSYPVSLGKTFESLFGLYSKVLTETPLAAAEIAGEISVAKGPELNTMKTVLTATEQNGEPDALRAETNLKIAIFEPISLKKPKDPKVYAQTQTDVLANLLLKYAEGK